ncbi:hypothetical protein L5515_006532 [Caenorhabditis briggsae]|uniref:Uncharacterized protein n=1 Tax=Caenorhabditis briggsae TaxID=6238 RepID=A0AAE9JJM4_CAEBR|nr:hypothetical protein L5515_006532 [Caenorhabditis briggsae]
MSQGQPLSYACTKNVIQQMEMALIRNLAERLPKTVMAERATPLKLRWLRLTPIDTAINEFIYRVQLVAVGPDACKLMKLYDGRIDFDLTKYGKRDYHESLADGDIVIEANDLESWKRAKSAADTYQAETNFHSIVAGRRINMAKI